MRRALLTIAIAALTAVPVFGQGASRQDETEQRLQDLKAQIEEDRRLLSETEEAERATVETLEQLDRQITLRKELIRNYRRRVQQITYEMDTLRTALNQLEGELNELKRQYQGRAKHAYKYGRMHDLALILSAKSINQMLIRVQYLHRFTRQRRERLVDIREAGSELRERRIELEEMLATNEQLLDEQEREQQDLEQLQQSRQRVLADLKQQGNTLEQSLERKQAAASELENRIRELTAAASSRRRIREAADPAAAAAYAELSGDFEDNRGRLPWPSRGVVSESFGNVVNPTYGTTTPNPGIVIETPASAEVRSVFEGQVIDVSILPEFGTYVVIEHGAYKSVYSNFSMTYVTEGDRVTAGQVVGRAGTDAEPKGKAVFFGLFKDGSPIDPRPWLRAQ